MNGDIINGMLNFIIFIGIPSYPLELLFLRDLITSFNSLLVTGLYVILFMGPIGSEDK
jgi:hypothetical protein